MEEGQVTKLEIESLRSYLKGGYLFSDQELLEIGESLLDFYLILATDTSDG